MAQASCAMMIAMKNIGSRSSLMIHVAHALLWLFVVLGIGLSVWSAERAYSAYSLSRFGRIVTGEIVEVRHETRMSRQNDAPVELYLDVETVEWTDAEGIARRAKLEERWERDGLKGRPIGTKVELLVDPAKPGDAIEASGSRALFIRTAGALFGLVFACGSLFMLWRLGGLSLAGMLALFFDAALFAAGAFALVARWRRKRRK